MKTCTKCGLKKNIKNFYKGNKATSPDGFHPWCKSCMTKFYREPYLKRTYGIDLETYSKLLETQNGGCAICGKKADPLSKKRIKNLAVDHDRNTGKVRGILCENCNRGIGMLKHSIDLMQSAISYLNKAKDKF